MREAELTLGSEVRRYRERAGLSQERLAEKLGTSREALSAIERGETKRPSDEIIDGFETYLGLSRERSYLLMAGLARSDSEEPGVLLQRIAALPDHRARMQAWNSLPEGLRLAVIQFSQDMLLDAAQRARESGEQNSRR